MRVIAGKAKGMRLKTPRKGRGLRPLTDQAREALFNILGEKVNDSYFLDLFAGSGAVGIEALSRGAKLAFFVELNRQAVALIRQNLEITGFSDQAEVYAIDVIRALNLFSGKKARFDIIFLGAPYDSPVLEKALKKIMEINILKPEGIMVAEHRQQHKVPSGFRDARYGETVLTFYGSGS